MARKANRFNAVAPVQQTVDMAADKTYRTALYARLSVELHSRPSDSINTQLDIMREYVKKHPELSECRVYVDSGYSGTNFERPSFNALMEDIKDGKINCILVKDDCVKIGLNRKSLIESRFSRRSPISLTGKGATSFARRVS